MNTEFVKYEHHGREVCVRKDLKGKHREHCLCHRCGKFKIGKDGGSYMEQRFTNCPKANEIYRLCVLLDLVLPVWECPDFVEGE